MISTPPIRKDLFRRNVWSGLISRKHLEWTYLAKAFGKELFRNACGIRDLFRESVWKKTNVGNCKKS